MAGSHARATLRRARQTKRINELAPLVKHTGNAPGEITRAYIIHGRNREAAIKEVQNN